MCLHVCQGDQEGKELEEKHGKQLPLKDRQKNLADFSFDVLVKELEVRAPLFLLVLKTAAFNSKDKNEKWKASITVAAATCLRNRSCGMIAFQLLTAILNRHSGFIVNRIIAECIIIWPFPLLVYLATMCPSVPIASYTPATVPC